jgi:methylated-DNA-protein-cysteine methyltransferase-like protein
VAKIPSGKVLTYGEVAKLIGQPNAAMAVGQAMKNYPNGLAWWRVVNRDGIFYSGAAPILQSEGVRFSSSNRVDLSASRWNISD